MAGYLLYQPGLNVLLVHDDLATLPILLSMAQHPFGDWVPLLHSTTGPSGRTVSILSFLLDAWLRGPEAGVAGWKQTNLLLHLGNGVLLFWFLVRLGTPALGERGQWLPPWIAALVAVVWLLHPGQVDTVLYTVQRMTELAATFTLVGLIAYTAGRAREVHGHPGGSHPGGSHPGGGWLVISVPLLWLPLAALAKESGVLLLAYTGVIECLFFRFAGCGAARARLAGLYLLPLLVALALLPLRGEEALQWLDGQFAARLFTCTERLWTELRVVALYAYATVLPLPFQFGFYHDDLPLSHGPLDPPTTLAAGLFLASLLLLALGFRQGRPLVAFGILWFLCGHSLEAGPLPLEIMYEHRNYLPGAGLLLALAALLPPLPLPLPLPLREGVRGACLLAAAIGCGALLPGEVARWRDEVSFHLGAQRVHPRSESNTAQLADILTRGQRYPQAMALLAVLPTPGARLQALLIRCLQRGALTAAELDAWDAQGGRIADQYVLTAGQEIGRAGLDSRCRVDPAGYLRLLARILAKPVRNPGARQGLHLLRARTLWAQGERRPAVRALVEEAAPLGPDNPIPLFYATEWLVTMGEREEARRVLGQARGAAARSGADFAQALTELAALVAGQQGSAQGTDYQKIGDQIR
jgi:hypothetical protein